MTLVGLALAWPVVTQSDFYACRPVNLVEYKTGKDSWDGSINGGSKVWATTDHLLAVTFKTASSLESHLVTLELGIVQGTGMEVGGPTTGSDQAYSATWPNAATGSGTDNVLAFNMFSANRERDFHLAASGQDTLNGTTSFTLVERRGIDTFTDGNYDGNVDVYAYTKIVYTIEKKTCQDACLDSRLFYGDANSEVDYQINPNTTARNVKFGSWTYKGGLFVGNMPWVSKDQSGVCRTQLDAGSTATEHRFATLSLFYLNQSANSNGSVWIGAFFPSPTDSNISVTESEMNWSNKWTITPRASEGTPPDFTQDPVSKLQITNTSTTGQYLNWPLTRDTMTYSMATQKVCLAIHDESNHLTDMVWCYFASREYQALDTSNFPQKDSCPRIWTLIAGTPSTWERAP